MNRQFSGKQAALVLAAVVAVFLLVGAAYETGSSGKGGTKATVTMADVKKAGGYSKLSDSQRQWVRDKYLHDLQALRVVAKYRGNTAALRGQRDAARDLANIDRLLAGAISRMEADPELDPTLDIQALINDVNVALQL